MLTVLTPTYDRAYTLPRLFASLMRQSGTDFEWLVVDDGSHDDTAAVVAACAREASFPVRCLRRTNGGKHAAVNAGVAAARGAWVFIVDSDDWLVDDALEVVQAALDAASCGRDVAGLCFRKCDAKGRVIGLDCSDLPVPWVAKPGSAGRRVRADLAYVCRREVMAVLPFPVIPGETFVPDQYLWDRVSDRGLILFYLDRSIYCCEYLDDGYTRNFAACLRRNPRGFLLFYASRIRRDPHLAGKLKAVARCAQCLVYRFADSMLRTLWGRRPT